jgi:hypothetical protein
LIAVYNNDIILNCDETSWQSYPNNILIWWDTAADDVFIHIQGDEKDCLTVLAIISVSGIKWLPYFLAKGKTERVERTQIGDVGDHWQLHTESGWMTSDTFGEYLRLLRTHVPTDRTIHLVLDMHSSHRTQAVKDLAASLNIGLHFIPAGLTEALQPLDRTIFGALKNHMRRLFRCQVCDNPWIRRPKHDAAHDMIAAWEMISTETLAAGWDFYENEWWEDDPELLDIMELINPLNRSLIQ